MVSPQSSEFHCGCLARFYSVTGPLCASDSWPDPQFDPQQIFPTPEPPAQIASGMAYLHSKDIIHGDLSAFNVMLTSEPPGGAGLGGRGFVAKVAGEG